MVAAWQFVANVKPPARPRLWEDPRFIWAAVALLGLILIGAALIAILDRWRKRGEPQWSTANAQLAHFRELYENGELSQSEFDRIRGKLASQLRKELDIPVQPAPPAGPVEPQPPASDPSPPAV